MRQETGSQAGKAAPVAAQASSPARAAGPDTGRPIPSPQQNSAPIVLTPVAAPLPYAPETPAPDLEAGSTANRPALSVQHTLAMRQAETVAGPATSQTTSRPPADPAPSNERSEGNASLPLASAQPAVSMAQPQGLAVTPAPILQGAPVALDGPAQAVPGAQVAALVDAVARAREGATPGAVAATLAHGTFGRVSLEFRQNDDGLSVTMASSDPGFAPAVLAATRTDAGAPAPIRAPIPIRALATRTHKTRRSAGNRPLANPARPQWARTHPIREAIRADRPRVRAAPWQAGPQPTHRGPTVIAKRPASAAFTPDRPTAGPPDTPPPFPDSKDRA
jgi:hypothetical protein